MKTSTAILIHFKITTFIPSGTNVTYKIQHGVTELANSSEVRGIVPHNITIPQKALQLLGLGCHQLTLLASNGVTAPDVSTTLELCVMEPVDGLQVSVASKQDLCSDSALYFNVSLEHGAPVDVLFLVSGDNDSFSETHHMFNGSLQMFRVSSKIEGAVNIAVMFCFSTRQAILSKLFPFLLVFKITKGISCYRSNAGKGQGMELVFVSGSGCRRHTFGLPGGQLGM